MSRLIRKFLIIGLSLTGLYGIMKVVANKGAESEDIDDDNPYLNAAGSQVTAAHLSLDNNGVSDSHSSYVSYDERVIDEYSGSQAQPVDMYEGKLKPILDQILSFAGLIILIPVYAVIVVAIKVDDPGPVFFTQKRVGLNKHFFFCHKFRSMKMSTPHDVPTHQLQSPESYITKVGAVLRRTSLDELPQIWDIFRGKMSMIGPRPALWNQDDLVFEREKYNANSVLPGLTGLAQISGRDELEIADKARVDGQYTRALKNGRGLLMDIACFFGTMKSVLKHDGVVEGGTGSIHGNDLEI